MSRALTTEVRDSSAVPDAPLRSLAFTAARAERLGQQAKQRMAPSDAFHAATRRFVAGERLDMSALAAELGVSRPTLYRWTGDRERLLVDVIWGLGEELFERASRDAAGSGAERLVALAEQFVAGVIRAEPMRRFLAEERDLAMRILTRRDGVHRYTVAALEHEIREEMARGYEPRIEPGVLAYAVVRLGEAFMFNDAINDFEPDEPALRVVLHQLVR